MDEIQKSFEILLRENWNEKFNDNGNGSWKDHWFLDGKEAKILNTEKGMEFYAGPKNKDSSNHAVLWVNDYFYGDVKIEFEFTRIDTVNQHVIILYIQATGKEEGLYTKDIAEWSHLREVPGMKKYFGFMHTYHISFATLDYIRARRYTASALKGTDFGSDYTPDGLFKPGVPHKMTVIKSGNHLYMNIESPDGSKLCHWHNTTFPAITEGRIGIRHMYTRAARYANVKIAVLGN